MAIKTKFSPATISHIIIGLMIFLWAWSEFTTLIALICVTVVAVMKEVFDYFFKIKILKWLLKQGFYRTGLGKFLTKNRFIMAEAEVMKAIPLFDFKDIVATIAIPSAITIIVLTVKLFI